MAKLDNIKQYLTSGQVRNDEDFSYLLDDSKWVLVIFVDPDEALEVSSLLTGWVGIIALNESYHYKACLTFSVSSGFSLQIKWGILFGSRCI